MRFLWTRSGVCRDRLMLVLCCCATGMMGLSQSAALTIYRIGGESLGTGKKQPINFFETRWDEWCSSSPRESRDVSD